MDLEQQLRTALMPCRPGPRLRAGVMARISVSRPAPRRPGRSILFTATLVLAAAAAMLVYLSGSQENHVPANAVTQIDHVASNADRMPETVTLADDASVALPADTVAVSSSRTVLLRPLQMETDNPAVRTALLDYYTAIVDALKDAPGVVLLREESADPAQPKPDFRLTLIGSPDDGSADVSSGFNGKGDFVWHAVRRVASKPLRSWQMVTILESSRAQTARERARKAAGQADSTPAASRHTNSEYPGVSITYMPGRLLASECRNPRRGEIELCRPASAVGAQMSERLRMDIIPEDPQLRRILQARVLDITQSFNARFSALELLARKGNDGDLNPEVIRAALDFVANSPDSYARTRVMDTLRGHAQSTLRRELIDMSTQQTDAALRMQALSLLVTDYRDDPVARAVLQSLAANDPSTLVRQVSGHALSGDGAWNDYVIATVKDASLSPAARFAPFAYLLQTSQTSEVRRLLDDGMIAALSDVLPAVVDDSIDPGGRPLSVVLLAQLPAANSPAAIDLVLKTLAASRANTRLFMIDGLRRWRDDPRVRSELENIASDDASPELRAAAGRALEPDLARSLE